MEVIGVP
jgi:hypothetical protein